MNRLAPTFSWFALLALAGVCLFAAYRPAEPLERLVSAETPLSLAMWRSRIGRDLSAEDWKEFDVALQELKYRVTARYRATGSDAVDEAMREEIDGQSIHRVLVLGCRAHLARLHADRGELERFMAENVGIRTRPDDEASINYLKVLHDRQAERLKVIVGEIAGLNVRLRQLQSN